jgi:hypothetical protein
MTRWIAASAGALALALTLGIAMPLGNQAAADGMKAPVYAAPTKKRCIAPPMRWGWGLGMGRGRGQPITWVCAATEICCYDRLFRKGHCLAATDRCF